MTKVVTDVEERARMHAERVVDEGRSPPPPSPFPSLLCHFNLACVVERARMYAERVVDGGRSRWLDGELVAGPLGSGDDVDCDAVVALVARAFVIGYTAGIDMGVERSRRAVPSHVRRK